MTTLGEIARQTTATARPGTTTEPTRTPRPRLTKADIEARKLARLTGHADATKVINDSDVTLFVEISEELKKYEEKLEPMKKKGSNLLIEDLNMARKELEPLISQCREEIADMKAENLGIIPLAAKREQLRASAQSDFQAFNRLDPMNFDRDSVSTLLTNAVQTGTLKIVDNSYVAAVDDSVLQVLEGRVARFFEDVKTAREIEKAERTDQVEKYLLSDYDVIQDGITLDSPLQAEKNRPGRVSYTRLKNDEGDRTFVPVHGTKLNEAREPTGEEYFMGEVLIERASGNRVATMASRVKLCEILFYQRDRNTRELVEKGVITIPSDLEQLHPKLLRDAIKRQMARDAEFDSRREKANTLSAAENYKDAVTFADFKNGAGKRWVVNAPWTPKGKERSSQVITHVMSDGKNFWFGESAYDLEKLDKDFFGMYTQAKPTPLSVLTTDKRFGSLAGLNRESEVACQLRREAKEHGNTTFLTKENVANALGLEGVDGVYAASTRLEQYTGGERHDGPRYTYLGYNVERCGGKVAITWATPGTAEDVVGNELAIGYPLTDLPHRTKKILCGIWMGVMRDFKTVPDHLKDSRRTTAMTSQATA